MTSDGTKNLAPHNLMEVLPVYVYGICTKIVKNTDLLFDVIKQHKILQEIEF